MSDDLAIKITGLFKEYRLGTIGGGSLQADIQSAWARFRKKEDPNIKIGQKRIDGTKFSALNGISFDVKKGERLGLIGGNGAGKSTTLKILSRVTAPTAGTVCINGRIASMLEVGTGFHPELTGRENIYLNGAILGMSKDEVDSKIEEIIEFSECKDFIDTPVKRYSSGMYVKLAFSVAAHLESEIVIMDEVLAVGDMKFQEKCLNKIKTVSENEDRTIIYVSHNMNTIRQLCNRCIVLDEGKVIFDGDVEKAISVYMGLSDEVKLKYQYSEKFRRPGIIPKLEIESLELANTDTNKYKENSKMNLKINLFARTMIEDAGIRFEIFNSGSQVVGTVFSKTDIELAMNQRLTVEYEFNTKYLTPGKYYAVALTFEKDELGNQAFMDRIEPAFYFEIVGSVKPDILWINQYWGNIRFEDLIRNQ